MIFSFFCPEQVKVNHMGLSKSEQTVLVSMITPAYLKLKKKK